MEAGLLDAVVLTREELYARLWARPLNQVAEEIGVSPRRLRRVCSAFDIPRPDQGYWRTHSDRRSPPDPLPDDPTSEPFIRLQRSGIGGRPKAVAASLCAPTPGDGLDHPLVRRTRTALSGCQPDEHGWLTADGPFLSVRPTRSMMERALLVMARLVRQAEANRWSVSVLEEKRRWPGGGWPSTMSHGTFVTIDGRRAEISVAEKMTVKRRKATPADRARLGLPGFTSHMEELHPTGLLWFRIHTVIGLGGRHTWLDKPSKPLERQVRDIAAGLAAVPSVLERKEVAEREARSGRERRERSQREAAALAQEEERRRAHLITMAERHNRASQIREFVATACQSFGDHEAVLAWASWARRVADELDPVTAKDGKALLTRVRQP